MTPEVVIGAALISLVAAALGYVFSEIRHRREMGVKMIEVAVGILAAEPDKTKGLRGWAVKVLDHYSEAVPLGAEEKEALRDRPLPVVADNIFPPTVTQTPPRGRPPRGLGAHGESGEIFETPMPPLKG